MLRGLLATIVMLSAISQANAQPIFEMIIDNATIVYDEVSGEGAGTLVHHIREPETSSDFPNLVLGHSASIGIDPQLMIVSEIQLGSHLAELDGGTGPDLFLLDIVDGGVTVSAVFSLFTDIQCTYEEPLETSVISVETIPAAFAGNPDGMTTSVGIVPSGLSTPAVLNIVALTDGSGVEAIGVNGTITITPAAPRPIFRRGDVDGNGVVNALSDAIALLTIAFGGSGGSEFPCRDSADVNDNGLLDIGDPVYLLSYGFGGGPAPVSPFTDCGEDPTDDPLDCAMSSLCP